jgi:chemotaxis response regulator CheB
MPAQSLLIVEDVAEMRHFLEVCLKNLPEIKAIRLASDVPEARHAVLRKRPDVVLLDEVLPGESAYDFVEELKGDGIPVVLLTSMEKPEHEIPLSVLGRLLKPSWDKEGESAESFKSELLKILILT